MNFQRIAVRNENAAAHITLANPPVNVIDIPMMEELAVAISAAEQDASVTAIVLRGEGKCFSAGVDIAAHTPELISQMLAKFHAVILAVANSQKVTIAAVHGNCVGGGAELAMMCDLVCTTTDANWGFPEIKLACFPPVACTALAALVGQKKAAELILTGRSFNGEQARRMGLANEEARTPEELTTYVDSVMNSLSKLSAPALALTKKASYVWHGLHLDKGLARAEKIYLEELMKTEDVQEGVKAWAEKRTPRWSGK